VVKSFSCHTSEEFTCNSFRCHTYKITYRKSFPCHTYEKQGVGPRRTLRFKVAIVNSGEQDCVLRMGRSRSGMRLGNAA
jgi:hypothetical protein